MLLALLLAAGMVVYHRIVQRLKAQNRSRLLERSSRWELLRFLWFSDESESDPALHSWMRVNRILMLAYLLVVVIWMVIVLLVLVPGC
ncbi:MAG: hypothetical protein WAU39_16095 [Polyangiales bacterium]